MSASLTAGFVEHSVGVFDVEPSFDGHVCRRRREMSSGREAMSRKKGTSEQRWRGEDVEFESVDEGHF